MIFRTITLFDFVEPFGVPKSNLSRKKGTTLFSPYSLILANKGIRENEKGAALLLRGLSLVLCTKCEAKNKGFMQKKTNNRNTF